MRATEFLDFLIETQVTLYHGTLTKYLPDIMKNGLVPRVGEFTKGIYGQDAQPLVFAADKKQVRSCYCSLVSNLFFKYKRLPTLDEFIANAAILVIKKDSEKFYHKIGYQPKVQHPPSVEQNDYYSREPIYPDFVIRGNKVKSFFEKFGKDFFWNLDTTNKQTLARNILIKRMLKNNTNKNEIINRVLSMSSDAVIEKLWYIENTGDNHSNQQLKESEFLTEDFLYPPGSELPANIQDFRNPEKPKRWFEPYTPEDLAGYKKHGFTPPDKGRWVEHGKTFVVLTKDNGAIVFWYDNYSNLLPSLREVFAVVDQNIDNSIQDSWDSIAVYKNGYLLKRSRNFGTWSGDVNRYSQEIQKTAQALLDRKIATTSTPLWIGNWAAGKGEYIGTIGKIVPKTQLPDKLVLYHGTSSYRLQTILQDGLKPIDLEYRVWNKGGLEKQRPEHRGTSVYLTASRPQAEYYAKKATDTDRARYNVNYRRGQRLQTDRLLSTIQHMEWELAHKDDPNVKQVGWSEQDLADAKEKLEKIKQQPVFYGKFEPIILQITITKSQYSKLMADDDYLQQHPNASATDWYDSLSYFGQVAFQGTVPPSKIKVVAQGKSAARVSYE